MTLNVSQLYTADSQWLSQADLTGPTNVTIVGVGTTVWDRKDEKTGREYKVDEIVLTFDGWDKKLSLRKVNAAQIAELLGDDAEQWIGHTITLYVNKNIQTPSGMKPGIRVMPVLPGAAGQAVQRPRPRPQGPGPAPSVAGAVKGIVARQGGRPTPPPQQAYEGPEEEYDPLG
jgi:hypothetical protein